MIYETVWWVVVGFCFLQELCKTAKNKKVPIGKFVQKGSNPPQPTTTMWEHETKKNYNGFAFGEEKKTCRGLYTWQVNNTQLRTL